MAHPLVNIATTAARKAGRIIVKGLDRLESLEVDVKSHNDYVSEIDKAAEACIISTILEAYPNHGIIAEESGITEGNDTTWIIDPLDGTKNFLHGFPHFAISIAVREKQTLTHGIIYDPLKDELFTATRGQGAQLNGHRIRVGQKQNLDHALLGTGFPFRQHDLIDPYLMTLKTLLKKSSGIRRAGAAALDLAYVAAGRLDGFWEFGLNLWDIAAGIVLVREAGGMVTDLNGGNDYLNTGNIISANPKVLKEIVKSLKNTNS